jgi:DNA repair protein RecN (Recombination protein N)
MLEDLSIKDFALIESDYLEFNRGFTVLSGETGAGKSILIGALSFLLGGKADVHQIRTGATEASVTGTFYLPPEENLLANPEEPLSARQWLEVHGINIENDRVILRRYIRDTGKSGAWIDNVPVTRADLAQFSSFLVDIHGQHEHQSLMKVSEHQKFLDARAGIENEVANFTKMYALLVEKRKQLQEYCATEGELERKIEMLQFAVQEISQAQLKKEEDVLLEEEENRLSSFEKIYSDVEAINNLFTESDNAILGSLKKLRRESTHVAELDKTLSSLASRVESSFYELSDICDEFQTYAQNLVFDPNRLQEIQERLSLIYNLKKKYATSVNAPLSEVLVYFNNAQKFLDENSTENNLKAKLTSEISALEKQVLQKALAISAKRKETSKQLSAEVEKILAELGMASTRFSVNIQEKSGSDIEQKCGPYGIDNIEFLISANPGSPLLPLAKIASGGELSRVMLALKTIFARHDTVETLIFDEIDTGIGGEVAVAVGRHLKNLAQNRQIFCITHLASIAVYADNQIKIEKTISGQITASNVYQIEGEQRVSEIARMLSGDSDNEQSLEHARTMLKKFSGGF